MVVGNQCDLMGISECEGRWVGWVVINSQDVAIIENLNFRTGRGCCGGGGIRGAAGGRVGCRSQEFG